MIILDAISLDLDKKVDHLATTWEVSDDLDFINIILRSEEDYKNKLNIIFSQNLDPNIRYYARARALLSTGWTEWGNVEVFKVINNNDLRPQDIFPTRVSIPRIETYRMLTDSGSNLLDAIESTTPIENIQPNKVIKPTENEINKVGDDQLFNTNVEVRELLYLIDPSEHDLTLFEIWAKGFQIIGNAKHIATSYWIENSVGEIIWASLVNRINRVKLPVKDIILKSNEMYRIRVVFHTDSNDVSQIGTYTIITGGCNSINLISYLDQVGYDKELDLQIDYIDNLNNVVWEILSLDLGIITSVWLNRTSNIINKVPANTLKPNSNYLLRIKTNLGGCYKYYPFITTALTDESVNDSETPLLVYPTDVIVAPEDNILLFVETIAKNVEYILEEGSDKYFAFDSNTKMITGIKEGKGSIYIKCKMDGYAVNIKKIDVEVKEGGISYSDTLKGYVIAKPTYVELNNGDTKTVNINTNCKKLMVEANNQNVKAILNNSVLELVGMAGGDFKVLVIGYDINNKILASDTVEGKVILIEVPDEEVGGDDEEDTTEYYLNVDPKQLDIKAGTITQVRINTNAPYWEINSVDGDFVTVNKLNNTTMEVISSKSGNGVITLSASTKHGVVKITTIQVICELLIKDTELKLDSDTIYCNINVEKEIPFTSNISHPDEYNIEYDEEKIELVTKKTSSFIIKPKYEAHNQSFTLKMIATKEQSETTFYNTKEYLFTVEVADIDFTTDDLIRFKESDEENAIEYGGGYYSGETFYPPNPITAIFYVKNIIKDIKDVNVIGYLTYNSEGAVLNVKFGNEITDEKDPLFGFKEVIFTTNTSLTEREYGEAYLANPTGKIFLKCKGNIYEKEYRLKNVPKTTLRLSTNHIEMDTNSENDSLVVYTNADTITVIISNMNTLSYTIEKIDVSELPSTIENMLQDGDNIFRVKLQSSTDDDNIVTVTSRNSSGVREIDIVNVKIGSGSGVNNIPRPGQPSFGAAVAPSYLTKEYNLSPADLDGVDDPNSPFYGNYVDSMGNIMVYIPKMYFRYDNSPEVINTYRAKLLESHQNPTDNNNLFILRVSLTPKEGYFLDRCFINNGKEIDGIFVDKFITSFSGTTDEELSIPRSVEHGWTTGPRNGNLYSNNAVVEYPENNLTQKYVTIDGVKTKLEIPTEIDKCYVFNLPKNRHPNLSFIDPWVHMLLIRIGIASYHNAILSGTDNYHPFKELPAHIFQPIVTTRTRSLLIGNYNWKVVSTPKDDVKKAYRTLNPVAGGGWALNNGVYTFEDTRDRWKYISHNGYSSGVINITDRVHIMAGICRFKYDSEGKYIEDPTNPDFRVWAYKLTTDRSNITHKNVNSKEIYDEYSLHIGSDVAAAYLNSYYIQIMHDNSGVLQQSNESDVNSVGYMLTANNLPCYKDHIKIITDKNQALASDNGVLHGGYYSKLVWNKNPVEANAYPIFPPFFAFQGTDEIRNCINTIFGLGNSCYSHWFVSYADVLRMCIIPNVGKPISINQLDSDRVIEIGGAEVETEDTDNEED